MPSSLSVALAQYAIDRDPSDIIRRAKAAGAEVVVFPELFSTGYAGWTSPNAGEPLNIANRNLFFRSVSLRTSRKLLRVQGSTVLALSSSGNSEGG